MKKTIKISLCVITAVIMLSCNVFATEWAELSPNITKDTSLLYPENIASEQSAEKLGEVLDNAYSLGLFGGATPFAVMKVEAAGIDTTEENKFLIYVLCTSPVSQTANQEFDKSDVYGYINTSNDDIRIFSSVGDTISIFCLVKSGDTLALLGWLPNEGVAPENAKILLIKSPTGQWFYDKTDPNFAQYSNTDETANTSLEQINELYLRAQKPPIVYNYILDVPSIITAIPNGAKQIINNAFGFEIFGINVAGLLSVVLVVAIVAFVVKWLMSR